MKNKVWMFVVRALAAVIAIPAMVASTWAEEGGTVAALLLAYQRECQAQRAYVAFAQRAEVEGLREPATLFRALASAESVHAANEALALESFDVTPVDRLDDLAVGTTLENLQRSIENEVAERRVAYAKFIALARDEFCYDALATLRYSRDAEITHAIRLGVVLAHLEWAPALASAGPSEVVTEACASYWVCPGCGRVRTTLPGGHCDCGTSIRRFTVFAWPSSLETPGDLVSAR
jgi:rubrerythrin